MLSTHKRNSPTQIVQKRSDRLIDWTQSPDRDRLEVVLSLSRDVFRLFTSSSHLRHTARTLHGEINVRVSRGANNTVTSHVKDLPPSKGISVKPFGRLPSWRVKPTGCLTTGSPATIIIIIRNFNSNELLKRSSSQSSHGC